MCIKAQGHTKLYFYTYINNICIRLLYVHICYKQLVLIIAFHYFHIHFFSINFIFNFLFRSTDVLLIILILQFNKKSVIVSLVFNIGWYKQPKLWNPQLCIYLVYVCTFNKYTIIHSCAFFHTYISNTCIRLLYQHICYKKRVLIIKLNSFHIMLFFSINFVFNFLFRSTNILLIVFIDKFKKSVIMSLVFNRGGCLKPPKATIIYWKQTLLNLSSFYQVCVLQALLET